MPEPRKDQIKSLIQQLDVDPRLARERVRGAVEVVELDGAVYRGEEGAVEPSAALGDEFRDLWGGGAGEEEGGRDVSRKKNKESVNFLFVCRL